MFQARNKKKNNNFSVNFLFFIYSTLFHFPHLNRIFSNSCLFFYSQIFPSFNIFYVDSFYIVLFYYFFISSFLIFFFIPIFFFLLDTLSNFLGNIYTAFSSSRKLKMKEATSESQRWASQRIEMKSKLSWLLLAILPFFPLIYILSEFYLP